MLLSIPVLRFSQAARSAGLFRSSGQWLSGAGFLFLAIWCIALFIPRGHWWVAGNLHDAMLPIVAGHAFASGAGDALRTSFGWIYLVQQHLAWKAAMSLPDHEIQTVVMLGGILFGLALIPAYALVRRFCAPWLRLPWWGCVALLSAALSVRYMEAWPRMPRLLWYGPYNHHLWGLWCLQLLLALGWERRSRHAPDSLTLHARCAYGLLQALLLYVALHHKPSVFGGGGFLLLASLVWTPLPAIIRILAIVAAAGLGAMALTAMAGYDYAVWAKSLAQAMQAKQVNVTQGPAIAQQGLVGTMCWLVLRMRADGQGETSPRLAIRNFLALLGVLTASLGSFPISSLPFLSTLGLILLLGSEARLPCVSRHRILCRAHHALPWAAGAYLASAIALNFWGMGLVAWNRFHAPGPAYRATALRAADSTQWRFWLAERADAETIDGINRRYADFLREGRSMIGRLPGAVAEHQVASLAFSNPFPWFAGTAYPAFTPHWIDPGVTFDWKGADAALIPYYESADAVLVPVYPNSDVPHEMVNCHFLDWNHAHAGPFRLREAGETALLYARGAPMAETESASLRACSKERQKDFETQLKRNSPL